ncbi:T9SS type A sorting domain-containing protein [candidate division KSB1 bacterium]|nr:T9SS type A sorting domain-containing protein [candidate division KSB1 bacterium]
MGNPRILYAAMWDNQRTAWDLRSGGPGSGIWRSVDGGESWERLAGGLPEGMGKIGVAASPAKAGRVWAIVEAEGDEGGLYRSDDGGDTWKQLNSDRLLHTRSWYYMHVFADPVDENTVYVMNAPFMKSIDGGKTFSRIGVPHGDNHYLWINPNEPRWMVNANDGGANVSFDGGASWFSALNGLDDVGTGAPFLTKLAKSKQDPDLVFAVGESGVWRTDNFASNWTLTQMPPGWNGASSLAEVKISLVNPQIVWAGESMIDGSPLYVSSDGGLSFAETAVFPEVTLGRISGLETHPAEDSTAFALFSFASVPKILRTTDLGQTWEDISGFGTGTTSTNGFPDVAVNSLLVMPHDTDIIWAGTEIGIFESLDGGATWADANTGFPATLVFEMVIVNDQVVVATHGRGVWSVALPELAGYEPPAAVLAPRFNQIAGGGAGLITADLTLRSGYDSSFVVVDGEKFFKIDANAAAVDTVITFAVPVEQLRTVAFSLTSYKDGTIFKSRAINLDVFPLLEAQLAYSNDFSSRTQDFVLDRMRLGFGMEFETRGIQSPHPYPDAPLGATIDLTAILKIPIIVAAQNATLSYDDIAIVEPGTEGVQFGEFGFWDFVIVEGSIDNGVTWIPFADGYDARFDQAWLTAYNSSASGAPSMLRSHTLNMLDRFSAGDEVIIRFRLNIDEAINGWGWLIRNIVIQPDLVSVESNGAIPEVFSLSQNYPNPFNPTTQIAYALPQTVEVNLKIFNVLGQKVRALLQNKQQTAGVYAIEWDGKDDLGKDVSSGVYIYRIDAGDFVKSHKMMLLK